MMRLFSTLPVGSPLCTGMGDRNGAENALGFWLLPPWDFSHLNESHPMDHDSDSSGHANMKA